MLMADSEKLRKQIQVCKESEFGFLEEDSKPKGESEEGRIPSQTIESMTATFQVLKLVIHKKNQKKLWLSLQYFTSSCQKFQ